MSKQLLVGLVALVATVAPWSRAWAQPYPSFAVYKAAQEQRRRIGPRDPADNRLAVSPSARLLRRGEWSFANRQLLTTELAFGVTDWLELGTRQTPLLMLAGEDGFANALWTLGLRLGITQSDRLSVAVEAEGVMVAGYAGLRSGVSARMGTRKYGLHLFAQGLFMFPALSDKWATDSNVGNDDPMLSFIGGVGTDLHLHRKVKLVAEASYATNPGVILMAPAIRLHGRHFATDLGVAVGYHPEERKGIWVPLVSFSVTY